MTGGTVYVNAISERPTKEFFIHCVDGTTLSRDGWHTGYDITGTSDDAYMEFYIPHDYSTLVDAVVVSISKNTRTSRLNFSAMYGAVGEENSVHVETLDDVDTVMVDEYIYEIDISTILTSLAAGDYVGVKVLGDAVNSPVVMILGIRFRYR